MHASEIKRKLQEVVGANPNLPIQAKVVSVENESCTVVLSSGLELDGVRIKASINESENFIMQRPKTGSTVILLSVTGNLDDIMIIKTDEIESVEINQNGLKILIDSADGKLQIENNNVSLKDIFQDLTDLLKGLKVYTGSGPSGVPIPTSMAKIILFETAFKKLLK